MIERHNRCIGIKLFRWRRLLIELWFCPKGEVIRPHTHSQVDVTIVPLYGTMWGAIGDKSGFVRPHDAGRQFKVPRGTIHSAYMFSFCIFAGVERWAGPVTSAALDFQPV